MNKKGFTLIEILAVIIIIGIMTTIGIVAISGNILKSRDSSVVNLAQVYADAVRNMRGSDDFYYDPKTNEAIIIPYSQVTGVDIENNSVTGYGDIIPTYCYVGVVNSGGTYKYYVTQVDDSYHFLDKVEYNAVKEKDILLGTDKLFERNVRELKSPLAGFSIKYDNKTYNIKGVRVKYHATGGGKNVSLYGYYTSDSSYVTANAHVKGNIASYDTFMTSSNKKITYNNVEYTVSSSEIMYLVLTL